MCFMMCFNEHFPFVFFLNILWFRFEWNWRQIKLFKKYVLNYLLHKNSYIIRHYKFKKLINRHDCCVRYLNVYSFSLRE